MKRINIAEAKLQKEGTVILRGFVRNLRLLQALIFIDLRDRSSAIQLVLEENSLKNFEQAKNLKLESYIEVEGSLQAKMAKKGGGEEEQDYELLVSELRILSLAEANLPIPVLAKADNQANLEQRFNWRHLDLRREENLLIFQVWTKLEQGFREYLLEQGFLQVYSPSIMSMASETGSEVFELKYFDTKAYLAQSPQFYKQMAIAAGMERVFICGPVFRAEASYTSRHTTEFTGWDLEMADIERVEELMQVEEALIIRAFQRVQEVYPKLSVPKPGFPSLSMKEVKAKLVKAGIKGEKEHDLSPEEEREISKIIKEEQGSDFVFIKDYDIEPRPFYHMRYEDNPQLTKSFDLLYKGIEISTGSIREHRLEILRKQAQEKGMDETSLEDYFNFFRYACPPHGGIGIGPARIIMKILGLDNVKEVSFLARDVKRIRP